MTFDFSSDLLKRNLLIVDRETKSVWSQLEGAAVSGELEGTPLEMVPALQTSWKHWRELYPSTLVLFRSDSHQGIPYRYQSHRLTPPHRSGHNIADLGLGVMVGEEAMFFPLRELNRSATPLQVELGGESITIQYRDDAVTAWAEDEEGELLPGVLVYTRGWMDFHPKSAVFRAAES